MSDYGDDQFENEDHDQTLNEKKHKMKISIDFLSVKDLKNPINIQIQYSLKLLQQSHTFKSAKPTAAGQNQEVKLQLAFASYEFFASKTELFNTLNSTQLVAKIIHKDGNTNEVDFGEVEVFLRELLQAPMRQTPNSVVRVSDQQLPIKDFNGQIKGVLRSVLYLEDLGEIVGQIPQKQSTIGKRQQTGIPQENKNPNQEGGLAGQNNDVQAVYNLELWKRAEEAKFKAYLKQKEIERIEEITYTWKNKEADRERQFADSLAKVTNLENKLRQKALDLQRREEKIVQLEEELKHKIQEVTRQLTLKEEEIMNVKKRFKEEKVLLEQDKKRLVIQLEEHKSRLEQTEGKYYQFKKEIDESPLTVLRQELGQKNLEIIEKESQLKQANEQKDEFMRRYEQVKKDMINLKKTLDKEKQQTLQKQGEELENLKTMMRNKQAQEDERREITLLRSQLMTLQTRLSDPNNKVPQQQTQGVPETINDRGTYNPFYQMGTQLKSQQQTVGQQSNIFLDNYARQQQSPMKDMHSMGMLGSGAAGVPSINGISMPSEVERLMRERDDLLRSGCYTPSDPLIMELERQIRVKQLGIQ